MLDIKWIRNNPDEFKKAMIKRGEASAQQAENAKIIAEAGVDANDRAAVLQTLLNNSSRVVIEKIQPLEKLDEQRRQAIFDAESLKAERNTVSKEVGRRKANKEAAEDLLAGMKEVADKIKNLEKKVEDIDQTMNDLLMTIPNVPSATTPVGHDETANLEVRKCGTSKDFAFAPKDHVDLGANLGILDFERAGKLTGTRFSVLMGQGARLERALINFMLDVHTQKHGYREVLPPFMVNSNSLRGTGQLPKFEQDLFKLQGFDYYLIPTAEVPVTNLYAGEILKESDLTLSLTAYTPCFRSEAGSYGRDTRGLIRQHQFD
ncbi:MAG: serine--tRNA ligase, partial [Candidatus Riflebacteria bacterium]